ncbi:putative Transposase-associated domain-containing protein [Helianthus annuus]|nr:putative Transposase-associated domain-containing protein [Helianthus annuus]
MDRATWMYYTARNTNLYTEHVQSFLKVAEANRVNKGSGSICCPCTVCKNFKRFSDINEIEFHLLKDGFMPRYTRWSMHGESLTDRSTTSNNLHNDNTENNDSYMNADNDHLNDTNDNLDEMIHDLETNIGDDDHEKLKHLFIDAEKPLYTGCVLVILSMLEPEPLFEHQVCVF